jgi:hypothetical protein
MRSRCLIAQPFRRDGGLLRGRRAATAARRCPPPLRAYQDATPSKEPAVPAAAILSLQGGPGFGRREGV